MGFLNMLYDIYKNFDPEYMAVSFDKNKQTFRSEVYKEYKATRKPAPPELVPQFALIREALRTLGAAVYEVDGYEGDDILGTLAARYEKELPVFIVTGDRDALQLATKDTTVYITQRGVSQMAAMTPEAVVKKYGITPRQVIDMKALMGDTSDNIPGVPGVGEKTAAKLLSQYQTLDNLYGHVGEIKGAVGKKLAAKVYTFSDSFGDTLVSIAKQQSNVCAITAAMPGGTGLLKYMRQFPERLFDVGIAEEHAATFSGGMAKEGLQPFCNIYSSFMQRAYDNVIHDIALLRLPVVLCLDRAGLVGEDGPTHHGVFDLAYFRPIPNLTIASPLDEHELRRLMYTAQLPDKGPFVIRYPRGRGVMLDWRCPLEEVPVGKGRRLKDGTDIAVVTLGPIGNIAARAIARAEKEQELSIAHYDLRFLKPLDEEMLHEIGQHFQRIVTVEDGVISGGMGSAVLEFMADNGYKPDVRRIGVPDQFIEHGTVAELYHLCGMDEEGICHQLSMNNRQ